MRVKIGRKREQIPSKILNVARRVRREILIRNGDTAYQCSYASDRIRDDLREVGINARKVNSVFQANGFHEGHCWVIVKYGGHEFILDITADQFNSRYRVDMRAIVFGTKKELEEHYSAG